MHHKRRRPKNRRAGCLMCKPWKANGHSKRDYAESFSAVRRRDAADRDIWNVVTYYVDSYRDL